MAANNRAGIRRVSFDAVLHAGLPKTGSTTIQKYLKLRPERLLHHGIYVPATGQDFLGSHEPLVTALGRRSSDAGEMLGALSGELSAAQPDRVLFSAEEAKRYVVNGKGDRLIEGLRAVGARSVTLILYLRSPFALANAIYSQMTAHRALKGQTFAEFAPALAATTYFDYDGFLQLAERPDVSLVVRPYRPDGILNDFLSALGIGLRIAEEFRLNPTFGPIVLEAVRRLCVDYRLEDEVEDARLTSRIFRARDALKEAKFWGVDEAAEHALSETDRKSDSFARSLWGRGWREVVPVEENALNVFDSDHASPDERALLAKVMDDVRATIVASQVVRRE